MTHFPPNHFEMAFENWLIDYKIQYVRVDQHKRAAFARMKLKSFDFLVYPPGKSNTLIIEVKGRKYEGISLAGLKSMQCWVTMEDIRGLAKWEEVFGPKYCAVFVFIYELANIDIDLDGRAAFEFDGRKYLMLCVILENYMKHMRTRSPKWQTISLTADDFRTYTIEPQNLIF